MPFADTGDRGKGRASIRCVGTGGLKVSMKEVVMGLGGIREMWVGS